MRYCIDVLCVEFDEGGNTIWVQGKDGTMLRIKTSGRISVDECKVSPTAHGDIMATGDIKICVPRGTP